MNILIMGLGHLAQFLVKELDNDYHLWGTHRKKELNSSFENIHKIEFHAGDSFDLIPKNVDVVIWNFPPIDNYEQVLRDADNYFSHSTHWIFVSSTSVFEDVIAYENSPRKDCQLTILEKQLKAMRRHVSILRPGGLVDLKRHPGNFFKNKAEVTGSLSPVNLVHTQDVARFIKHVINSTLWGEDFNLVSSHHPTKQEFYSSMLQLLGHPVPRWISQESLKRVVKNVKSLNSGFTYQFDDLVAYFHNIR